MDTVLLFIALGIALIVFPGTLQLLFLSVSALLSTKKIALHRSSSTHIAIVIPAHNEALGITQTLKSLQSCDNPVDDQSIIVVADNCADQTATVAKQQGVRVIERINAKKLGKGYALNKAFHYVLADNNEREDSNDKQFEAVLVVDADTVVDKNFIDTFRNLFASGEHAGQARYCVKNIEAGVRPRLMNIAFLAFNLLRPLGRDNIGLSAGILGNGFGVSTEVLKKVPYDSFSIVEDLEYHLRLVKSEIKVKFLNNTTVWSDMPVTGADAQSQRERWEGGRFYLMKTQIPALLSQIIKGRFRCIEPLLDLLLLPLAFHSFLLLVVLIIGAYQLKVFALIGLAIVSFHVTTAMFLGGASWQDWKALIHAPFYITWKIMRLRGIVRTAKKGDIWKYTRR